MGGTPRARSPVGLVEVSTSPWLSVATHSVVNGREAPTPSVAMVVPRPAVAQLLDPVVPPGLGTTLWLTVFLAS